MLCQKQKSKSDVSQNRTKCLAWKIIAKDDGISKGGIELLYSHEGWHAPPNSVRDGCAYDSVSSLFTSSRDTAEPRQPLIGSEHLSDDRKHPGETEQCRLTANTPKSWLNVISLTSGMFPWSATRKGHNGNIACGLRRERTNVISNTERVSVCQAHLQCLMNDSHAINPKRYPAFKKKKTIQVDVTRSVPRLGGAKMLTAPGEMFSTTGAGAPCTADAGNTYTTTDTGAA